jgi:hypothetical protein
MHRLVLYNEPKHEILTAFFCVCCVFCGILHARFQPEQAGIDPASVLYVSNDFASGPVSGKLLLGGELPGSPLVLDLSPFSF